MTQSATNIMQFPVPEAQVEDMLLPIPGQFRLLNLSHQLIKATHCRYSATLYNEACSIRVCWSTYKPDSKLKEGVLVSPRGLELAKHNDWAYEISALSFRSKPDPDVNLFHTIPTTWVKDREIVEQAAELFAAMPRYYRHLFNAIFWDSDRFKRYCMGPSSLQNHHSEIGGNLRHSVEIAKGMELYGATVPYRYLDAGLCILLAFLHDAGKADEYRQNAQDQWVMSDRGALVGHKVTITEWIAVAKAVHNVEIPDGKYLALLHCLNCAQNPPQWLGIREMAIPEAFLLSGFDRMSGKLDFLNRLAPSEESGWGQSHMHMKGRPFYVGGGSVEAEIY